MLMILLAAFGLWFLFEGLVYAAAPDAMKRFGEWLAGMPEATIRQSGLLSMGIGGLLVYVAVRFGGL